MFQWEIELADAALVALLRSIQDFESKDPRLANTKHQVVDVLIKSFDSQSTGLKQKSLACACIKSLLISEHKNDFRSGLIEFVMKQAETEPTCGLIYLVSALIDSNFHLREIAVHLVNFLPFIVQYIHDGVLCLNELLESFIQTHDVSLLPIINER